MVETALEIGTDSQERAVYDLSRRIETASPELGKHCRNVGEYSHLLAGIANAPYPMRDAIKSLGKIHDIGKTDPEIAVLLNIPFGAPITDEQYALFKSHASKGAQMARQAGLPRNWAYVIETHHEDFNGRGYMGLRGDEIPLAAQVIRIADSYASILERKDRDVESAREDILSGMGTKYNPYFADPFEKFIRIQRLRQ